MSYVGKYASSFSVDNDKEPQCPATLVIDVRPYVSNADASEHGKTAQQWAVSCPNSVKYLLPMAEAHLRDNPDGHVAFGCRLGKDRSVALAQELDRRVELAHYQEKIKAQWAKAMAEGAKLAGL